MGAARNEPEDLGPTETTGHPGRSRETGESRIGVDIVHFGGTPRGRDFGRASSGFFAFGSTVRAGLS